MGFSNEYLTEEEIELFKETEHWAFIRKNKRGTICLEKWCTTDREKRIWLMRYPRDYSYDPNEKEDRFIIFYGDINNNNFIELCMKDLGEDKESLKKYGIPTVQYWAVKEMKVSPRLKEKENDIKKMLEEIMTAFGICGNPKHKGPGFDGRFKAIIKEYND